VELAKALSQFELDQELPDNILKISPSISGKLTIQTARFLEKR